MLRLPDDWVWDSWIAQDGETYHLFYLKAPRALEDPTLRHARATIGHATRRDLVDWTDLGTTLAPSAGGWDDLALWTGSTVRGDDGSWRMFYTALNTAPGTSCATSASASWSPRTCTPGVVWRTGRLLDRRPALVPDARRGPHASETWRDPFVFRDPDGDGWHMLVTARAADAPRYDDGVLAHARARTSCPGRCGRRCPAPVRLRADRGAAGARGRRAAGAGVHLPPRGAERRARPSTASGARSVAGEPGGSLLGPWDLSRAVPFRARADAVRRAARPAARRRLGAGRVPQPGAGGDPAPSRSSTRCRCTSWTAACRPADPVETAPLLDSQE